MKTAMHGETFAYAKYLLFAKHARQNGNTKVADLFESAANVLKKFVWMRQNIGMRSKPHLVI